MFPFRMFGLVNLNFLFPLEEYPSIIVIVDRIYSCEEEFSLHSTRHPALSPQDFQDTCILN